MASKKRLKKEIKRLERQKTKYIDRYNEAVLDRNATVRGHVARIRGLESEIEDLTKTNKELFASKITEGIDEVNRALAALEETKNLKIELEKLQGDFKVEASARIKAEQLYLETYNELEQLRGGRT